MPIKWVETTPTIAKASVVFKSAVPPRKNGTKTFSQCSDTILPIEPIPGKSPSQLFNNTKKKKLAIKGKKRKDFSRELVTESKTPKSCSTIISKIFCALRGITPIARLNAKPKIITTKTTSQVLSKELVM